MFLPKAGLLVGNRYELTKAIGRGGMGEVWKAHDHELDTPCAVKFILQHLATDRGIRERFSREAKAVARLRSPHVVQILGVGEIEDTPYLAMELLSGETLLARLDRLGKLDPIVTMKVVEQVGEALESAHQAGIVHRDLKPENIWFWSGSKVFVKVLDFGVAKTGLKTGSLQTATGALVGTPQYMSPEQALGNRDVDHRSDLWSLAVITVECLCGKRPFESEGLGDLLLKIVSNTPPSLHELAPELPPSLHEWWARALARDPRNRFQSASELTDALRPHLVGNAPYSELVYSGLPHSGLPHSGLPHSGLPHSGLPHSGLPHSDVLHSDFLRSGRAHSGRALDEESAARAPGLTDAGGVVRTPSEPVSRPVFPTEVQPRSAEWQGSGQPHSAQPHSAQPHFGQPPAGRPWSEQVHGGARSAGFPPLSNRPHSSEAEAPRASTGSGVVSERAQQQPAGGSVGPISSSRRLPPRDGRRRTVVIAAALVAASVVGTAWRMLGSDPEQATSALLPPPGSRSPSEPAEAKASELPASPPTTDPSMSAKPASVAELPSGNPWLGSPKPGEPSTAVEALKPRATRPTAPEPPQPGPAAGETAVPEAATPPRATALEPTPPRATPPRTTPPRAAPAAASAPAAAAKPATAPPRKAPTLSAADVGLSVPAKPAQSAANAAPGGAHPRTGDAQAELEAKRRARLKKIGLGSE